MPVRKRKPLVILYTGRGKGKTTAALGIVFRAWGRGLKVVMLSFIKSETSNYGEERAARKLGIEMIPLGGGFTWLSKDIEKDKALAQRCWGLCKEKIASGEYDIVILDVPADLWLARHRRRDRNPAFPPERPPRRAHRARRPPNSSSTSPTSSRRCWRSSTRSCRA